jgi:threonine dehydrogenase-like Zn-dependent dehydrogenase
VPGHEVVGTVAKVGRNVTEFVEGDRCVADPGVTVIPFSSALRAQLNVSIVREVFLL